ncbi:MAG: hypothetical protein SF051_14710, partial [Elusimicrobiota bacterium]|nr:hypothetical protein [Elusimicrobiota bacterium]
RPAPAALKARLKASAASAVPAADPAPRPLSVFPRDALSVAGAAAALALIALLAGWNGVVTQQFDGGEVAGRRP